MFDEHFVRAELSSPVKPAIAFQEKRLQYCYFTNIVFYREKCGIHTVYRKLRA